jgi:hypothetical protein
MRLATMLALAAVLGQGAEAPGTMKEARELLDKAIDAMARFGEVESLQHFNQRKGRFRPRDLFVFCFGPDDKVTAHATLPLGSDIKALHDADGHELGKALAAAAVMGDGTVEYRWKVQETGAVETRIALVRRTGSQVCGVSVRKEVSSSSGPGAGAGPRARRGRNTR